VYIDDYAHHQINAVYQAVRNYIPIKVHLVSASFIQQNKIFADDFAKSLSQFDELLLLDIYPARELPMEGITSEWLLGKVDHKNKLISKRM
jgi:UDP-N-acetylmuramate--alanine ligase